MGINGKDMAKSFIITFTTQQEYDNETFVKAIQAIFTQWGRISESSYIVLTELNPSQIIDKIRLFLPEDARIFVCKLQRCAAWSNTICSSDWIKNNLSIY